MTQGPGQPWSEDLEAARLVAASGDVKTATRMAQRILHRWPECREAADMLDDIAPPKPRSWWPSLAPPSLDPDWLKGAAALLGGLAISSWGLYNVARVLYLSATAGHNGLVYWAPLSVGAYSHMGPRWIPWQEALGGPCFLVLLGAPFVWLGVRLLRDD
jgi:hypothetical protein